MSIEDVDYMIGNSDENSIVIFVDSKNRDLNAYPKPSSYVVDFSEHPIKNVYGIEILDATIPATAYTIDEYSCNIGFSQVFNVDGATVYDTSDPTSFLYNIARFQFNSAFDILFSANGNANIFICTNYDNWSLLKQGYNTSESTPNVNVISNSTIQTVATNTAFYIKVAPISDTGIYSLTIDGTTFSINDVIVYDGYINIENTSTSGTYATCSFHHDIATNSIVYFECVTLDKAAAIAHITNFQYGPLYDLYVANTFMRIVNGSYTAPFLLSQLQAMFNNPAYNQYITLCLPFSVGNYTFINPEFSDKPIPGTDSITQLVEWTSASTYPFIFDMRKTTANYILGFSEYANSYSNYVTFTYNTNMRLFMSTHSLVLNSVTKMYPMIITSPGVVNLESVRYLILRCPEIESHLLGSYANFKYAPGVGLFKLTTSNSLMNLRFDFVNITRKPFHPIGKLAKLTFTFETSTGDLYDFKGVDHVLLLSIRYYAPKHINRLPVSILNPYYNPNILDYQLKQYGDGTPQHIKNRLKDVSMADVIREQKEYM